MVLSEPKQNQIPEEHFQKSLERNSFFRKGPKITFQELKCFGTAQNPWIVSFTSLKMDEVFFVARGFISHENVFFNINISP